MSVIAHFSHAVFVVYLGVYVGSCTHKYDESASLANQCICMFVHAVVYACSRVFTHSVHMCSCISLAGSATTIIFVMTNTFLS